MRLRLKLLNIFFINLVLINIVFAQIGIFPFKDESSYKGTWKLSYDVPNLIAEYLRTKYDILVLSPYLIEKEFYHNSDKYVNLNDFLSQKNINYLIEGKIKSFNISRLIAGEPLIAQYETYTNSVEIEIQFTDLLTNKIVFIERIEQKSSDLGVGVTLFGRESEARREFYSLDKIKFGSNDFFKTLVGKNLLKFCDKLSEKIEKSTPLLIQKKEFKIDSSASEIKLKKTLIKGEILFVDESTREVFINLGKKDNISVGSILPVYSVVDSVFDPKTNEFLGLVEKKIGEIEILEIRGERFSLGIIKNETERIVKGNQVREVRILSD